MSKIAIISDIHSNIHALDLVLKDMEKRGVTRIICLGDIVTKYFYPKEVVDEVKEVSDVVLKGNCDDLVATNENYKFARGKLGVDRIEYLDSLPTTDLLRINGVLLKLYHSNPRDLESMFNPLFDNSNTEYKDKVIPTKDYKQMFDSDEPQTSIVGHTHMNYIGKENDNQLQIVDGKQIILPSDRSIINVGSVAEHVQLEKKPNGTIGHIIEPFVTYLIVDSLNISKGVNIEIIKVPYKEELKKVFIDSIDGQKKGEFPYSPMFSQRMADSIVRYDSNYKNQAEQAISENIEAENRRKGR